MSRRRLLQGAVASTAAVAALGSRGACGAEPDAALPKPTPGQLAWQNCEVGCIFHYDMTTFRPFTDSGHSRNMPVLPAGTWNPTQLDTDQWVAAAQAMGARYALLTATHESGFLQWQSDLYDYGCRQSPWLNGKGDLVEMFVESCRRAGIQPGLYVGLRFNAYHGIWWYAAREGRPDALPTDQYMRLCERMVEELCSRYGKLIEIWFDGGVPTPAAGGPDILPIVDRHQPDIVFYHSDDRRHHRYTPEQGVTPDPTWCTATDMTVRTGAGDPDGRVWSPVMALAPLRKHDWFYRPDREDRIAPLARLTDMYERSVGLGANLILGIAPDRRGLVPEADVQRMTELGAFIKRQSHDAHPATAGSGANVTLALPRAITIDRAIVMEDIAHGQRIRRFRLEVQAADGAWREVSSGESIGHKRLARFQPVEAVALRLVVLEHASEPRIRKLAALPVVG